MEDEQEPCRPRQPAGPYPLAKFILATILGLLAFLLLSEALNHVQVWQLFK
jgi:hypothetical protein